MSDQSERDTGQDLPQAQPRGPAGGNQPGDGHEARVNQQRHEPTPASHHADQDQQAPATSEQHAAARTPGPVVHGDAVRDMMGGPPPQGDVPDAPGTQIAAANPADAGPDRGRRVRHVANAVPGKPDGEVDTRS